MSRVDESWYDLCWSPTSREDIEIDKLTSR